MPASLSGSIPVAMRLVQVSLKDSSRAIAGASASLPCATSWPTTGWVTRTYGKPRTSYSSLLALNESTPKSFLTR